MMEWSGLSFHFNLHTTEEDSSAIFSADVETVCEPTVTQHDPLPPLTGEWNCIWLSIGSESSLFWGGFVYRGLSAEVENHLCVCICETLFSRSTTPSEGNRHFNKVFLRARQVAALRVATRASLWVTTQRGGGRASLVWWRAPIFTASLFGGFTTSENTERRDGYEDQVDWAKRCWRLSDDV